MRDFGPLVHIDGRSNTLNTSSGQICKLVKILHKYLMTCTHSRQWTPQSCQRSFNGKYHTQSSLCSSWLPQEQVPCCHPAALLLSQPSYKFSSRVVTCSGCATMYTYKYTWIPGQPSIMFGFSSIDGERCTVFLYFLFYTHVYLSMHMWT